jgi:hypothetical protein
MNNTHQKTNSKLYEFRSREFISLSELKDKVLSWFKPYKLYTKKLSGANRYYAEAYTVNGPSGRAVYNYQAKGYMIVFDTKKAAYRTIVWKNVEKITDINEDRTFYVR